MTGPEPARVSAFLRELADMLDVVPGLPVPFTMTAQASVSSPACTEAVRFARVHDVAELLCLPVWTDYRGGRYVRYGLGQFTYLVYASADYLADASPLDSRDREQTWVVTRAQDEDVARVDSESHQSEAYGRGRRDGREHAARLAGALHSRGLELSPTTLTRITQGEETRV